MSSSPCFDITVQALLSQAYHKTSAQLGSSNSRCQDTEQLRCPRQGDKPHFNLDMSPGTCKWSLNTGEAGDTIVP